MFLNETVIPKPITSWEEIEEVCFDDADLFFTKFEFVNLYSVAKHKRLNERGDRRPEAPLSMDKNRQFSARAAARCELLTLRFLHPYLFSLGCGFTDTSPTYVIGYYNAAVKLYQNTSNWFQNILKELWLPHFHL